MDRNKEWEPTDEELEESGRTAKKVNRAIAERESRLVNRKVDIPEEYRFCFQCLVMSLVMKGDSETYEDIEAAQTMVNIMRSRLPDELLKKAEEEAKAQVAARN